MNNNIDFIKQHTIENMVADYETSKAQAEQAQANIDYISMMVDVPLPEKEENDA